MLHAYKILKTHHLMFPVENYDGGVEEDAQHPHHDQVGRAHSEHLQGILKFWVNKTLVFKVNFC